MFRAPRLPSLNDLAAFARLFEFRAVSRWVGLGVLVGIASGASAVVFLVMSEAVRHFLLDDLANLKMLEPGGEGALFPSSASGAPRAWVLLLVPAVGGIVSGLLVRVFCPEAAGGNEGFINAFHRGRGRTRKRVAVVKSVAAALFIGSGNSAGREGPIAHVGASLGSMLGEAFKLSDRERRLLLVAGAAGGIGAIFRTPLGGALFVLEVLYRDDFEVDALVPAVLSSVVAYSVFTLVFGEGTIFLTANEYPFDPRQLPLYLLMAVGAALVGVLYVQLHHRLARMFAQLHIPYALKPGLAGLAVGAMALVVPQALGTGYGWIQEAIVPTGVFPVAWPGVLALLGIALAKTVSTCISVTSGSSGGVFGPSVVIGGMVGGAFGLAFHQLFPALVVDPGAFVIVGMACFVGGVCHAPISTLVMATEMTKGYDLLVPIMLAEVVTFALMRTSTIYPAQPATRRDSPAHGGEYVLDVLQDIRVRDAFTPGPAPVSVSPSMSLPELLRQASESTQAIFPVLGEDGKVQGVVPLETLRAFFYDEDIAKVAVAADCMMPLVAVSSEDTLATALARFASSHYRELPVIDDDRVKGLLGYEELLQAYSAELVRRRLES